MLGDNESGMIIFIMSVTIYFDWVVSLVASDPDLYTAGCGFDSHPDLVWDWTTLCEH